MIHEKALVHPNAKIAEGVEIGPFSIIGQDVIIGKDTWIGPHVVITGWTTIGNNCKIFQFCSIGEGPQDLKFKGGESQVIIGDNNVIREFVTINRATTHGGGKTILGDGNYLMAYAHVAHDCIVGNQVIMSNTVSLGGHIEVEDGAIIGGLVGVHQFVRIGAYSFIGGVSGVTQDIPPYILAVGQRCKPYGLNMVGLKRHGFPQETIKGLKKAYKIVFMSGLILQKAIKAVEDDEIWSIPEVVHFIQFIQSSKRGICR
ncbi:MAG: acyl-ACP--UDP-N-acetylglucosamine O-acyltransferase [Syntrophobacterales bacterium]|nr:MAG: acyl-ACP--UDP-N-acetylglucosamine O-acyltransferase [Syntrophobacterales bacterium]